MSRIDRQEIAQLIQVNPLETLQSIADKLGCTRERVRQICNELKAVGAIEDRKLLKRAAIEQQKAVIQQEIEAKAETRRHRRRIWRRMTYVGARLRLRHAAGLNRHGLSFGYHMPGTEVTCQFNGCNRSVDARGFCCLHYAKLRMTGALWVRRKSRRTCKENECRIPVYARDMCLNHYNRFIRNNPVGKSLKAHNTSGYRGVSWRKTDRCWAAYIYSPNKNQEYLGSFDSKEMAARAYDTAARRYFGDKAILNFPDDNIDVIKPPKKIAERRSGVPGVVWDGTKSRWNVRITRHGQRIYAGSFIDIEDAIAARKAAEHANQP
jgi:hypothetical protein